MAVNGDTPSHSRTFKTTDELLSWTADEHARCLAEGWSWPAYVESARAGVMAVLRE